MTPRKAKDIKEFKEVFFEMIKEELKDNGKINPKFYLLDDGFSLHQILGERDIVKMLGAYTRQPELTRDIIKNIISKVKNQGYNITHTILVYQGKAMTSKSDNPEAIKKAVYKMNKEMKDKMDINLVAHEGGETGDDMEREMEKVIDNEDIQFRDIVHISWEGNDKYESLMYDCVSNVDQTSTVISTKGKEISNVKTTDKEYEEILKDRFQYCGFIK